MEGGKDRRGSYSSPVIPDMSQTEAAPRERDGRRGEGMGESEEELETGGREEEEEIREGEGNTTMSPR